MFDIQNIILGLRKKYEQSYGFAAFDLDWKENEDSITVSGEVLTEKQREETISEIGKVCDKKIEDRIQVLSDPDGEAIGWVRVKKDIADMKSRFVSSAVMNDKILKRVRASQAVKGEVLRVLLRQDDQILAQSDDLALGWVDLADVTLEEISLKEEWRSALVAKSGELIDMTFSEKEFIAEAENFLGVKYVLGAKSEAAIDCSGFAQLVFRNAFDVILPRHSWDQKKMGIVVDLEKAQTGDLVFMINKNTNTKHVGIWEKTENESDIIHASFSEGKVVRQKSDEVFEKYKLVEVRRIVRNNL